MKMIKYAAFVLLLVLCSSCTVNKNTVLIKIYNLTDKEVTSFKIGETLIFFSLASGAVYNYWGGTITEGKVSSETIKNSYAGKVVEDEISKISMVIEKQDPYCIFMLNHEYHIDIIERDEGIVAVVKAGISTDNSSKFHYPAN